MKKSLLILVFFLGLNSFSQNNQFKIDNISVDFGWYNFNKKHNDVYDFNGVQGTTHVSNGVGAAFGLEVLFSLRKNLFSVYYHTGAEIGIPFPSQYKFNEISLLYGRRLNIKKGFRVEPFIGAGYFSQKSDTYYVKQGNSLAIPLKLNFIFKTGQHFEMGIKTLYDINQINNYFSTGIAFGYHF